MCRVLGPLLQDGTVAKIADDLKSYSATGRRSYKPYITVTCVCLPTRPLSAPRPPLFSAGSGLLVLSLPVPTA